MQLSFFKWTDYFPDSQYNVEYWNGCQKERKEVEEKDWEWNVKEEKEKWKEREWEREGKRKAEDISQTIVLLVWKKYRKDGNGQTIFFDLSPIVFSYRAILFLYNGPSLIFCWHLKAYIIINSGIKCKFLYWPNFSRLWEYCLFKCIHGSFIEMSKIYY